jgi:hypothetical protein
LINLPIVGQIVLAPAWDKASEDDPNLLYDGVADTLVSLLSGNVQHVQPEEFPISD